MNLRSLVFLSVVVSCMAGEAWGARERAQQPYPSRPVRFIVPFPPGGGTDILARILGQKLSEATGQQFVIDNRGGGASLIGSELAAKAAPDGHTILLGTASFAISAGFYKNLPYDPVKDFDAVGLIAMQSLALVKHPALPANTVRELVAYGKAHPDKVNYASGGEGGINHLAAELLMKMTGTRMVHIPYKGAGPALTALLGGEVQFFIPTLGSVLPHVRSGKLKALAVASAQRSRAAPELPTVAESGVPGYEATNWYGVLAPRATPQPMRLSTDRWWQRSRTREQRNDSRRRVLSRQLRIPGNSATT